MAQLHKVSDGLKKRFPQTAALLEEAAEDILAHRAFPNEHRRQLHSTNPLERLNKEIKRRSRVVEIFPNTEAVVRLIGALVSEQTDEWQVTRRYMSLETLRTVLQPTPPTALIDPRAAA